jgi:hypothetical protein
MDGAHFSCRFYGTPSPCSNCKHILRTFHARWIVSASQPNCSKYALTDPMKSGLDCLAHALARMNDEFCAKGGMMDFSAFILTTILDRAIRAPSLQARQIRVDFKGNT